MKPSQVYSKRPLEYNTKHKTHKTHNNQHEPPSPYPPAALPSFVELHLNSVFWFGIGRYFPGILPTDTKGKLGRDVSVSYIWREPLFSLKGRLLPPFWWTKPPFWGKNKFPPNLQKGVPAKFHKMELPPNLTVQKYQTKYTNRQVPVTYQYRPNCQ